MKVYQNLEILGSQPELDRFIVELDSRLTGGWCRDHAREREVHSAALGPMYCYAYEGDPERPASKLWIAPKNAASVHVSNILPEQLRSLTYDQYNGILQHFNERCASHAAFAAGVSIKLSSPELRIEDFLSLSAAALLRTFSRHANRMVLHPMDRQRWNEFLTAAYQEGASFPPELLVRWLVEEERWPEDEASNLAIEFEHARELLAVFDSRHA